MSLTNEQLAMRKTGITGSEISAVCGLNPWTTAVQVWENKLGLSQPEDLLSNPNLLRGTLFERPILEWYCLLTNRSVESQPTIRHAKYPIIMATPDGISRAEDSDDRVVEVKCPTRYTAQHWSDPDVDPFGVPEYYLPQIQMELAVTGLKQADVVCFSGIKPEIYRVDYDDELFEAMREQAERFWHDHIVTGIPPPPDDSAGYAEFLARHMPQSRIDETIDLTGNAQASLWLERLRKAKETLDGAKSAEQEAKNNLKAMMGKHAYAKIDGAYLSWKQSKPVARVQWKELAKAQQIDQTVIDHHTVTGDGARPFKVTWSN